MKTSIIILTYNKFEYTKQCIESIRQYTAKDSYEIIVVDNASTDETVQWLKQQDDLRLILNTSNNGFPKGCNQGIEIATGDSILLLNNDTVVTKNWLLNLTNCLYSDEKIGAVGPITNSAAYYTSIPVEYQTIEEMQNFAEEYNQTNALKWEERLKLIGFCLLIKKSVVDQIGMLDERFTPGNFEDDDYSIRIRKSGYKLKICKDTFIHHYGSVSFNEMEGFYTKVLSENEKKFKNKWGTDSSSYFIHNLLLNELPFFEEDSFSILHIGCHAGATILEVKNRYKNSLIFGVEENISEYEEASNIGTIYRSLEDIKEQEFDCIILTDNNRLSENKLITIISLLKENGILVGEFLNAGYHQNVQKLMAGGQPFIQSSAMYGLVELNKLFEQIKGKESFEIIRIPGEFDKESEYYLEQIKSLYGENIKSILESTMFLIKFKKTYSSLNYVINKIEHDENISDELFQLNNMNTKEIIRYILSNSIDPSETFQKIAVNNFYLKNEEHVLPYLQAAYEHDPLNSDTIYNIGFVLNAYGEDKLALKYLNSLKETDEKVSELYKAITNERFKITRELTFLLRRIEFGLNFDKSREELCEKLRIQYFKEEEIYEVMATKIYDKVKVLQTIAVTNFEKGYHEDVLPYLNLAFEIEKNNIDTLYNLAYALVAYGQRETAINYLDKIPECESNSHVLDLRNLLQGEKGNE
jgi:O-antigen biosynthesis protein